MGAVSKPLQRKRRKMRAVIVAVVILMPVLCLAVVASIGAWQHNKTIKVYEILQQITFAAARYRTDFNGEFPPSIQALLDTGYLEEMPASPVDGRTMHVMQPGSTDFVGGVSIFLLQVNASDGSQGIDMTYVVCYHNAPSFYEVAWSWLAYPFIDWHDYTYPFHERWPFDTKPDLVPDGENCDNNQPMLARGLTSEQARNTILGYMEQMDEIYGPGMWDVIDTAVRE